MPHRRHPRELLQVFSSVSFWIWNSFKWIHLPPPWRYSFASLLLQGWEHNELPADFLRTHAEGCAKYKAILLIRQEKSPVILVPQAAGHSPSTEGTRVTLSLQSSALLWKSCKMLTWLSETQLLMLLGDQWLFSGTFSAIYTIDGSFPTSGQLLYWQLYWRFNSRKRKQR